jgi:hypothetical protein
MSREYWHGREILWLESVAMGATQLCSCFRVYMDALLHPPVAKYRHLTYTLLCCCNTLQCAMARMPGNPELLLMHANFLIEVHKDGQAANTQIQLAQKANPGLLDSYSIYAAQQLAKKLRKGSCVFVACSETVYSC